MLDKLTNDVTQEVRNNLIFITPNLTEILIQFNVNILLKIINHIVSISLKNIK